MYLKSLELTGFKSFAKKANLQFTSSITAIVGPNGSGKSNTAEAFRFVLGEQSIKSLRGKRGEDMIWNGGGEAGRANRASVKLVFDNSTKFFPTIDFDEVSIERIVHRDNTNEYMLNGSQVRLKDIVEALGGAHIGATGHHIISQGEADRILSASIRERREMVEDALGLKVYQWKKLESIRKLERTEENMKQVESLRREIAPHLRFLKKQVEKIEKAEELRKELVELYKVYFARETSYIESEESRVKQMQAAPAIELRDLEVALERAKKILTDSKNKDHKSEEVIALENRLTIVRKEKDGIMRELGRIEGEIGAHERTILREKDKQKRDEFKTVYLKDVEEVVRSIEGMKSTEDARGLFSEIIGILKSFIVRHRGTNDSALIAESEREMKSLSSDKEKLESSLVKLSNDEASLESQYRDLKDTIEKEKDTNREAEKDVFKIIARQNELRHILSAIHQDHDSLTRAKEALKRDLDEAHIIAGRDAVNFSSLVSGNDDRAVQADRRHKIERLKIRLEDSGAGGGHEVLKEYKETEDRDAFLAKELEDLGKAKEELSKLIAELDIRIDYEFKSGIVKINAEFQKFFSLMFGGGQAEVVVVKEKKKRVRSDMEDLSDALSHGPESSSEGEDDLVEEGPEGLDVSVNLPRKKVKGLMMLSGGERALTSIALLFAISQVNPPPFIILDETDAALDEANSKKYGDMIEDLSKHSQLILITHNRETMSRAGVLYGVTMGSDGASRLLSIAFDDAVAVAK